MFENPRRARQVRNFGKNVPKIVDLKSSSEQIFPKIVVGCPCSKNNVHKSGLVNGVNPTGNLELSSVARHLSFSYR